MNTYVYMTMNKCTPKTAFVSYLVNERMVGVLIWWLANIAGMPTVVMGFIHYPIMLIQDNVGSKSILQIISHNTY